MRPSSESVTYARLLPALSILIISASWACAPASPPSVAAVNEATCAGGEPYLAIVNRTDAGFDIYTYTSRGRTYVGSAGSTDTRFSLVGTPAEHSGGVFVPVPAGKSVDEVAGKDPRSPITLTWKCDRSAK